MLHDFYLRNRWSRRHRNDRPIYIEIEPDMERIDGGTYRIGDEGSYFYEIRGVNPVTRGAGRVRPNHDGNQYFGQEEFQIPESEMERINSIGGVIQDNTKIYMEPWVLRVINVNPLGNEHTYRVQCERTRDPFPKFTSAWDFQDDTVGEAPDGWVSNDPFGRVNVQYDPIIGSGNKAIRCEANASAGDTENCAVGVDIAQFIGAPAINIKWRMLLESIDLNDKGYVCWVYAREFTPPPLEGSGTAEQIVYIAGIGSPGDGIGPAIFRDLGGLVINYPITLGEWFDCEFTIDRINGRLYGSVEDQEFSLTLAEIGLERFPQANWWSIENSRSTGSPELGTTGICYMDNVEVNCLHAL